MDNNVEDKYEKQNNYKLFTFNRKMTISGIICLLVLLLIIYLIYKKLKKQTS